MKIFFSGLANFLVIGSASFLTKERKVIGGMKTSLRKQRMDLV